MSFTPSQNETAFNYADTVRSYGSAADELESQLPRISHDYIQNIQKPMAAVAPSMHAAAGHGGQDDRNLVDNYCFSGSKPKLGTKIDSPHPPFDKLKVNIPRDDSCNGGGMKSSNSMSSLQTAEDSQRYFWDSFDLNGQANHTYILRQQNIGTKIFRGGSRNETTWNELRGSSDVQIYPTFLWRVLKFRYVGMVILTL